LEKGATLTFHLVQKIGQVKLAELFKMSEAERLFNDVVARCFDRWRFVLSFRITSKASMAAAAKQIEADKVTFVADMFHGSDFDKILINKEKFFHDNPPEKIIQEMTEQTVREMELVMNAASVVFVHSVLDAAAYDYCRVTALAAPNDWEGVVEKKGVPLAELKTSNYDQLLQQKLTEYFAQLERESLLTKADQLLARCKPEARWSPMNNYEYDRDRLKRLDEFRHNVIHGDGLGMELNDSDNEVDYLMRTALYFMGLVNLRYGFQINPIYTFQAMAEARKAAT
jgi:hypothetical protein